MHNRQYKFIISALQIVRSVKKEIQSLLETTRWQWAFFVMVGGKQHASRPSRNAVGTSTGKTIRGSERNRRSNKEALNMYGYNDWCTNTGTRKTFLAREIGSTQLLREH